MHKTKNWGLSQAAGAVNKWKNRIYEKSKNSFLTFRTGCVLKWVKSFTPEWAGSKSTAAAVKIRRIQEEGLSDYSRLTTIGRVDKACPQVFEMCFAQLVVLRRRWCGCRKHYTVRSSSSSSAQGRGQKFLGYYYCFGSAWAYVVPKQHERQALSIPRKILICAQK